MADDKETDTQAAGKDPEPSAEDMQVAKDVAKHLEGQDEGSPGKPGGSGQEGAEEGADDSAASKAPTLTKKQEAAVKAVGLTPEKVLAMGDEGIAFANTLVKQRADVSRFAGEADHLRTENESLKAKADAEAGKAEGDKAKLAEITEEDDYDEEGTRDKINDNFRNAEQRLVALEDGLQKILSRAPSGVVDSDGAGEQDKFFADKLGEGWTQFGEGPMDDLAEYSPEALARNKLVTLAAKLEEEVGLEPEQAKNAALSSLYPDDYKNAAVRDAKAQAKGRKRGSAESPTGRASPKPPKDVEKQVAGDIANFLAGNQARA